MSEENIAKENEGLPAENQEAVGAPKKPRVKLSGIELLKVVAIFIIVISHVVQTLTSWEQPWTVDISAAINDPATFIIAILRYSGALGNIIFFSCSAWFLLDKDKTNYQKVMRMLLDIFVISVLWLIPILIWKQGNLDSMDIVRSLLPTIFFNNWYMTSYILFCLLYPALNLLINHMDQRKHLIVATIMFLAALGVTIAMKIPSLATIAIWVVVFFVMGYFKRYGQKVCDNKTLNIIVLISAVILHIVVVFVSNLAFIKYGQLGALRWNDNGNFLFWVIAFCSLNLMRMTKFTNKVINYVSGLSMLIYLIHENILFRNYIRPLIWEWIYYNWGFDLLFLWIALYAIALALAAIGVAVLYKISLQKPVHKLADAIWGLIEKIVIKITDPFIKKN